MEAHCPIMNRLSDTLKPYGGERRLRMVLPATTHHEEGGGKKASPRSGAKLDQM